MVKQLQLGEYSVDLAVPQVMGILNVTPDSFCPQGRYQHNIDAAVEYAASMAEAGAGIIDIGGESTRPGAEPVPVQEELDRVIPVIEALRNVVSIPISVDTSQPQVMRAAAAAGVDLINDVRALRVPGALETVAHLGLPVCLMHMRYLDVGADSVAAEYTADIVEEINQFMQERIQACLQAGIAKERLLIDPGFGGGSFGKNLTESLQLLAHLEKLKQFDLPILVGLSRKGFLRELLNIPIAERVTTSVVAAVIAIQNGANIVRVHDVKATVEAVNLMTAIESKKTR